MILFISSSKDAYYALRILEDVHHEFEKYDYTYSTNHYFAGYDRKYSFLWEILILLHTLLEKSKNIPGNFTAANVPNFSQ